MTEQTQPLILTIDDDPDLAAVISFHIRQWGLGSASVASAEELRLFLDHQAPAVMLMDVMLGDDDGSDLVAEVKRRLPHVPVIMITRDTSIDKAVCCMKHGAADYITKPLDFARLEKAVHSALEVGRVARSGGALAPFDRSYHGLVGRSPAMCELFSKIGNVASADVSALILGETGTGKELVARAIHRASPRRDGPFVAVNAAAIPHELIESQLFGHERGAFTGAGQAHVGFCEQADGGTLFLDEIAEMSFDVQAKLLRFLQDHEVQRVGARKSRRLEVRVLAATNVDPHQQIAQRRLREDLYYRLRVVSFELPPLRERPGDVELLAEHFLEGAERRHGNGFVGLAADARRALVEYHWPGNVRELENVIEEAVVVHRGREITAAMLPTEIRLGQMPASALVQSAAAGGQAHLLTGPWAPAPAGTAATAFEQFNPYEQLDARKPAWSPREQAERRRVAAALERCSGQVEDAAAELGMSRATIYRRMKKYSLPGRRSC